MKKKTKNLTSVFLKTFCLFCLLLESSHLAKIVNLGNSLLRDIHPKSALRNYLVVGYVLSSLAAFLQHGRTSYPSRINAVGFRSVLFFESFSKSDLLSSARFGLFLLSSLFSFSPARMKNLPDFIIAIYFNVLEICLYIGAVMLEPPSPKIDEVKVSCMKHDPMVR